MPDFKPHPARPAPPRVPSRSYVDIGEEDDWSKPAPGASDDEGEDAADGKKRRKGADGEPAEAKKASKADKRDRQRLANMFAKNAAAAAAGLGSKRKAPDGGHLAAQETAQDADSLLEDILAGVGGADAARRPPSRAGAAGARRARRLPRAAAQRVRRQPPSVAATPATTMKPSAVTPSAPRAAAAPPAHPRPTPRVTFADEAKATAKAAEEENDDYFIPPPLSPPDGAGSQREEAADMDADDEPPSPAAASAASRSKSILKPSAETAEKTEAARAAPAAADAAASPRAAAGAKTPAAPGAAEAYAAVFSSAEATSADVAEDAAPATMAADGSLPLDADDSLPFFLLDAHEDISAPGTVFLFGRVPVEARKPSGETVSACAVVTNMQRCMFVVPTPETFADPENELSDLEDALAAGQRDVARAAADPEALEAARTAARKAKGALLRALQLRAADVKAELREMLLARGVEHFSMKPVKRSYCFERGDVPRGSQYVVKVRYPAANAPLPADVRGRTFSASSARRRPCSSTS